MSEAAVDSSTLCLFDVDGTLTAARQVVRVCVYKTNVISYSIHTNISEYVGVMLCRCYIRLHVVIIG